MRPAHEKKTFVDFSKTEEGKKIFEKNKSLWTNGDFLSHLKTLISPKDTELAQIMRKYQSSFTWIHKDVDNLKAFQIRHTPTARPEDLTSEVPIVEGYLWLEVLLPEKYPDDAASFAILNHSIPKEFKRLFEKELFDCAIETKSIFRTLKYMDNQLDKLFEKVQQMRFILSMNKPVEPVQQPQPEKVVVPPKKSVDEKEKAPGGWTQELQKQLEKAIIEFKDIKDPKEKWQKIASKVEGKTMSECVQRFKDCKKMAEEKKNEVEEESKGEDKKGDQSSEEESDEDEEDDSDEESGDSDNPKEEEKENRKIRDHQEYEASLDSLVLAKNIRLENVSVGILYSIQIQVSCVECKGIHEVEAVREDQTSEYLVNNEKCPKCGIKSRLVAKQEIFHETLNAICALGSFTWEIRDLHFCSFDLTCEFCDTANRTKKIISGQPVFMECKGCFKKMQFSYMALTLSALALGGNETENDDAGGAKNVMNRIFTKKTKFEFKVGFPLPNSGACKHYSGSKRYFRFPCCGKAYPCDDCHNRVEKHEMQLAKSMICGFCSSEQPIEDTCKRCAKAVTKIVRKTAYWEGGKGVRNTAAMSRKDPHKFKGLGKTISNKQKSKKAK